MQKTSEEFIRAVSRYKKIAIYIPGSPDPDAIASAYAIKMILQHYNIGADIFAERRLSLAQNQAFIARLNIPVSFGREVNVNKYDAYIVPDFQNNLVEKLSDKIPCAAHFDHHGKSDTGIRADFSLIRTDVGSTCTLIALIMKSLQLDLGADLQVISTALVFGIQTDTDKYNYMTPLDLEALDYLAGNADNVILEELNSMPPSTKTLLYFKKALQNEAVYKDWAFYGIGYIDSKSRDSIAITADMLLKKTGHRLVAVFAIVENNYRKETYLDVSLRSRSKAIDMNKLIKKITPNGGGRHYKGAYQVKLNYLKHTPDKEMLWQVVETATLETLRRSRDTYYISSLESVYNSIKSKVQSLIKTGRKKDPT